MDNRAEVRDFLATRRAKLSPQEAGVPLYGTRRRVPGLRREEVAQLAGLSTDYYTRLEKGNLRSASDGVLEAIARALQLDDAERGHLLDLARAARGGGRPASRRPRPEPLRASLQHVLDAISSVPAFINNGRLDLVGTNALARAMYADVLDTPVAPANFARFCFLDPRAHDFYPSWERAADTTVALLRTEAGRDPHNRKLSDLVGELATRSDAFRTRWATHDVHVHVTGSKVFRHAVVGHLHLAFNTLPLPGDPGLSLTVYTPEPGTGTDERLALLASWAATPAEPATTSRDSA
jgi:transcriptional regulator with XRE-family HTH domain